MIGKALENLGVWNYMLEGHPTNEQEFNSMFKKVVGEDENKSAILSDDVSTFGVTWEQVSNELNRLTQEYNNTVYQRLRKSEYPDLTDFADAYYWAQKGDNTKMNEYITKCDNVKEKYPKVTDAN